MSPLLGLASTDLARAEPSIEVSIGDASVVEGDVGPYRLLRFVVTLSVPSTTEVAVDYTIAGTTATGGRRPEPGVDFRDGGGRTRTIRFKVRPGGVTPVRAAVAVPVFPDTAAEGNEELTVTLSNASAGLTIRRAVGTGTILDDDPAAGASPAGVRVAVGDASLVEGDEVRRVVQVPVTLSQPVAEEVLVDVTVAGGTATCASRQGSLPGAVGCNDLGGRVRTLRFRPGATGLTPVFRFVAVVIWPDAAPEADETVLVTVADPRPADPGSPLAIALDRAVGTVTVLDDDEAAAVLLPLGWGSNSSGQLGDGSRTATEVVPAQVGLSQSWTTVAAGSTHACAVRVDGSLWCWGPNASGQLGDGTTVDRAAPVPVSGPSAWASVSAGAAHTCAVRTDGTLWCWGANSSGEAGSGGATPRTAPVQVGTESTWATVEIGPGRSCGTRHDGSLWCWGAGYSVSSGPPLPTWSGPVQVGQDATWLSVSVGWSHSCGIRSDASLWCWGDNWDGQLGNGTTVSSAVPTPVAEDGSWGSVSAGFAHTCAVRTDASLWCWGANGDGRLGDGTTEHPRTAPVPVAQPGAWVDVAVGEEHSCAREAGGALRCWGYNLFGQLGDGTTTRAPTPSSVVGAPDWTTATVGTSNFTCGVRAEGSLWCWGNGFSNQTGLGPYWRESPAVLPLGAFAQVSAGSAHACGTRADGSLWCWGANSNGQLGIGYTAPWVAPTQVGAERWLAVSAADSSHTCAIRVDTTLWCWGANYYGGIGSGTYTMTPVPLQVGSDAGWASVSAGNGHTCATRVEGSLWCWGQNFHGQVGDGTTAARTSPVQVGDAIDWTSVSAGGVHTCAARSDRSLWCWGWNGNGQVGDGTTTPRSAPVQVAAAMTWAKVDAGAAHTCALATDARLWCWGYNEHGQVGDGTTTDRPTPVAVGAPGGWTSMSAGWNHTCAIADAGSLWCWGANGYGSVGDGTTVPRSEPVRVGDGDGWALVSAGVGYTLALTG